MEVKSHIMSLTQSGMTARETLMPCRTVARDLHDKDRNQRSNYLLRKNNGRSWKSTVIATDLPSDLRKDEVEQLFSSIGALQSVTLSQKGGERGLEVIAVYENSISVHHAVQRFDNQLLDGKVIHVKHVQHPSGGFEQAARLAAADEAVRNTKSIANVKSITAEDAFANERAALAVAKLKLQQEREELRNVKTLLLKKLSASSSTPSATNAKYDIERSNTVEATSSTLTRLTAPEIGSKSLLRGSMPIMTRLGKEADAIIPPPETIVQVAGLPEDVGREDVVELFGSIGDVIETKLEKDRNIGARATVTFASEAQALAAVSEFNGRELDGRSIKVTILKAIDEMKWSAMPPKGRPIPTAENVENSGNIIPIFASPIMMFDKTTGQRFADGTAPEKASLFFPSLASARWSDPNNDIYIILNFLPHTNDLERLKLLDVNIIDADQCLQHTSVRSIYSEFSESCPIGGKADLGGSGIIGVMRFFALQGAMEMLNINMVFFLEGDNILLRPVQFLADVYRIRENRVDATITHISFHASFLHLDFVKQMNEQARSFALFTRKKINSIPNEPQAQQSKCFLTGGGQDMRLGYEAAKFLQIRRQEDRYGRDARILNTAGGTVPCGTEYGERRWVNALGMWCESSKETVGPCALEAGLKAFNEHNGAKWTSSKESDLPMLLECDPKAVNDQDRDNSAFATLGAPGSIQQNLKGKSVKQSPGGCGEMDTGLCDGTHTDGVEISTNFYCNEAWVKANPTEQNNKAIYFKNGRVYSRSASSSSRWVEHYNLHYQGGGCKTQMKPTFVAVLRSAGTTVNGEILSLNAPTKGFTCEETTALRYYERCLFTGDGAVDWIGP